MRRERDPGGLFLTPIAIPYNCSIPMLLLNHFTNLQLNALTQDRHSPTFV